MIAVLSTIVLSGIVIMLVRLITPDDNLVRSVT